MTEVGDVEVTLDDCWSLDLNKRDRWKSILGGTMADLVWKGDVDDDGSEMTGEGDSDYDDYDDDDDEEEEEEKEDERKKGSIRSIKKKKHSEDVEGGEDGRGDFEESKKKESKKKSKKGHGGDGSSGAVGVRAEVQQLRERLPDQGQDDRMFPLYGQAVLTAKGGSGRPDRDGGNGCCVESLRDFYRYIFTVITMLLCYTTILLY